MRRPLPLLFLSLILFLSCGRHSTEPTYHTGDLLFVCDTAGMGQAIAASTGQYTHVAIVQCTDSEAYVVEALPRRGVVRRPLDSFSADYADTLSGRSYLSRVTPMRLTVPFDTALLLRRLQSFQGLPYDDYFLPHNGRLYCSELAQACLCDTLGFPLFPSQPMNFLAPDSTLPSYWQRHFDSLGIAVPQGTPGTNPTALAHSPLLKVIHPRQ